MKIIFSCLCFATVCITACYDCNIDAIYQNAFSHREIQSKIVAKNLATSKRHRIFVV
ncbi:TPA_asm: hypothetical protein [Porphyromonas phage phage017a_JCVISC001]|uniref:Lipoprotein n=1 Tax=Porphyromonas phage phage017a_JCVISC001 TaxID=3154107 RepID=A0AAT9J8F5_9CAUD